MTDPQKALGKRTDNRSKEAGLRSKEKWLRKSAYDPE